MSNCPFFKNGVCLWASMLSESVVETNDFLCRKCIKQQKEDQRRKGYKYRRPQIVNSLSSNAISVKYNLDIGDGIEIIKNKNNWKRCHALDWLQSSEEEVKNGVVDGSIFHFSNCQVLRNQDLMDAAIELAHIVKDKNYTGIVGIPRSGMLPAATVATNLSLPLYSISNNSESNIPEDCIADSDIIKLCFSSKNGGLRMEDFILPEKEKLLFIDDSSGSGWSANKIKERFKCDIAVCFSTTTGSRAVDYFARRLEDPHLFEWNFFGGPIIQHTGFDIDGVMCPNVPYDVAIDHDKYSEWIANAKPLKFMPVCHKFSVHSVITGRLEKYRSITEKWLTQNGVKYHNLIMVPDEMEERRNENHFEFVGSIKAKHIKRLKCTFFVESELAEANVIKSKYPAVNLLTTNSGNKFGAV